MNGPNDLAADDATRVRLGIVRLARRLRQEADSGLSASQLSCLATVEREGPIALGALAERERVAAPTITGIVARLADDGLVTRSGDPSDRRSKLVTISPAGRDRLVEVRQRKNEWLRERLADMDPDDIHRLLEAVEVMERLAGHRPEAPLPAESVSR